MTQSLLLATYSPFYLGEPRIKSPSIYTDFNGGMEEFTGYYENYNIRTIEFNQDDRLIYTESDGIIKVNYNLYTLLVKPDADEIFEFMPVDQTNSGIIIGVTVFDSESYVINGGQLADLIIAEQAEDAGNTSVTINGGLGNDSIIVELESSNISLHGTETESVDRNHVLYKVNDVRNIQNHQVTDFKDGDVISIRFEGNLNTNDLEDYLHATFQDNQFTVDYDDGELYNFSMTATK